MEIRYNVTGAKRKELVKVISKATGMKAVYKFMPTCNFEIGSFTVNKEGTLLIDAHADNEEVARVLEAIAAAGFEGETQDNQEAPAEEVLVEEEPLPSKKDAVETAKPTETDITEEADNNEEEAAESMEKAETTEAEEASTPEAASEHLGLTVDIPLDKVDVGNLTKLLDAKGCLIKKAL